MGIHRGHTASNLLLCVLNLVLGGQSVQASRGLRGKAAVVSAKPATLGDAAGRPAWVVYPDAYEADGTRSWPLILMLHGMTGDSYYHDHFLGISERVNTFGFIALLPNGTVNSKGVRFWNGIHCCDFDGSHVNDTGYLVDLVQEAVSRLRVDPKRVSAVGHSNGAAMTQILACQHAELFNSVASIAPVEIPIPCTPSHPVNVLEVVGTKDPLVKMSFYGTVLSNWTHINACTPAPSTNTTRDYDCDSSRSPLDNTDGRGFAFKPSHGKNCALPGNETRVVEWTDCGRRRVAGMHGASVAMWAMEGAQHAPGFSDRAKDDMVAWLLHTNYTT